MTNLPRKTANLPHSFATSCASGGGLLQVGGRLLQLVATRYTACLCGVWETVAGVAAFSKTFPKRKAKEEKKREKKAYRDNNRDNLPHLPHLPPGNGGVSALSPTPLQQGSSPATGAYSTGGARDPAPGRCR